MWNVVVEETLSKVNIKVNLSKTQRKISHVFFIEPIIGKPFFDMSEITALLHENHILFIFSAIISAFIIGISICALAVNKIQNDKMP